MDKKLGLEQMAGIGGFFSTRVMNVTAWDDAGRPAAWEPATEWSAPEHNLMLPAGFNPTYNWFGQFPVCHAGTGTTPNTSVPNGTYSQTGTTVTRATGTGTFTSGNVNDFVKFATGERAKITAFTNSVTVTVDRSQTVAAAALTVYKTSRVILDTWVAQTSTLETTTGANGYAGDSTLGTARYWKTYNFDFEVAAKTYTEVGVGSSTSGTAQLLSRQLLDSPVNVGIGQFLQIRYDLIATMGNCRVSTPITPAITGWPYTYNVQSIVSNGTYWDVVLNEACDGHYAVGRPITIAGALPATTVISTFSSTSSDFTVNATAHGKSTGDSIVIEGATPAGYNGTWTVATSSTNSFTVTSAANLGTGSGGTVRYATPGTWYNGTHTIASFPNSTTIRITNANTVVAAGVAGTVQNSLAASIICTDWGFYPGNGNVGVSRAFDFTVAFGERNFDVLQEANLKTGLQYGVSASTSGSMINVIGTSTAYDVANRKKTFSCTFLSGVIISQTIRQIVVLGQLFITFDERQRKNNGYQLIISYTLSWEPDLA